MKQFLKSSLFFILRMFYPNLKNKASILMYHFVGNDECFFTVSKKTFERQLAYLKKQKFNVIKLSDLIKRIKKGRDISNCVCLTFDDGYKNIYDVVFPILKKYNLPITVFLITDLLGKQLENSEEIPVNILTEHNVRECAESDLIEFMPHAKTSRLLNELSPEETQEELNGSRQRVEEITGVDADVFSYPQGKFTEEAVQYLRYNNWLGAVTVKGGLVSNNDDIFLLNRNSIDSSTSFAQFKGKVSGAIDKYKIIRQILK